MADLEGFEPPHTWTKTRCLTAWLQVKNGEMRRNWTADTVSFNHMLYLLSYHPLNGRRGRTWTYDPCAPNAVLCQTELLSANGALGRIRTSEPEGDGLQPPVFNQTSLPTHFFFFGEIRRTRTFNLLSRNQMLYPIELQSHWLQRRDLNPWLPGYEPGELPLFYSAINILAETEGFEPPHGFHRLPVFKTGLFGLLSMSPKLVPKEGLEPSRLSTLVPKTSVSTIFTTRA